MNRLLPVIFFAVALVGCEASGPSEADVAQCMRFNQSKYDSYAASIATERARQQARANNAMAAVNSQLAGLTGYSTSYSSGSDNELVTASCRDYVLGCASPLKFQSECAADITFIWFPD